MRKAVSVESKRKAILLQRSAGRLAISATPQLIVNAASYSCFSVETLPGYHLLPVMTSMSNFASLFLYLLKLP